MSERMAQFVLERRRSVSVKEIADRFLCGHTKVRRVVNQLLNERKVVVEYRGRVRCYKGKHPPKE